MVMLIKSHSVNAVGSFCSVSHPSVTFAVHWALKIMNQPITVDFLPWRTTCTETKVLSLQKSTVEARSSQNIALHASPTARNSYVPPSSAILVNPTSFVPTTKHDSSRELLILI